MDNKVNLDKDTVNSENLELDEQKETLPVTTETPQQEFHPNMTYVPDDNAEKTFAVISIICGSLSIVTACIPVLHFILAAAGIIMAIIQLKERQSWHNLAKIGLFLSIGGIAAAILFKVFSLFCATLGMFGSFMQ